MRNTLSICLFCVTVLSVSSGQQVLNGIEGDTVTFPAAVKILGTFSYKGAVIGDVTTGQGTLNLDRSFTGRLQWDSSTGLFSISGLKMEDSGEYRVQNNDEGQPKLSVYKLTVSTELRAIRDKIGELVAQNVDLKDKIGELGAQNVDLKGKIGGVKGDIGKFGGDIGKFGGKIGELGAQNEDLKGKIGELGDEIRKLEGKIGGQGGGIGGIIAVIIAVILCAVAVIGFIIRSQRQLQNDMVQLLRDKESKRDGVRGIEDGESSKMMGQEGVMDTGM